MLFTINFPKNTYWQNFFSFYFGSVKNLPKHNGYLFVELETSQKLIDWF